MGSQDVLMAQLAHMEDVPGEFIKKASNSKEVLFILVYRDLECFG